MTEPPTAGAVPTLAQVRAERGISIRRLCQMCIPRLQPSSIVMIEKRGIAYPTWRARIASSLGIAESAIDWTRTADPARNEQ